MNPGKQKQKTVFLEELWTNKGNVSAACRLSNISREIFYRWKKNDKEFFAKVQKILGELIEEAKVQLKYFIQGCNEDEIDHEAGLPTVDWSRRPDAAHLLLYLKGLIKSYEGKPKPQIIILAPSSGPGSITAERRKELEESKTQGIYVATHYAPKVVVDEKTSLHNFLRKVLSWGE